jgi:hypothetical protein
MTLEPQQTTFASSAGTASALVILTGWYELEHGVAVCLGGEVLHTGESLVAWK